jgi:Ran GTPase-activating protein (RanGAP) involved in mRNA processing and transport
LQRHPALKKIHLSSECSENLPSLSGLEDLLYSQDSKVKEVVLEQVDTPTGTVGFDPVMQELGRNTTVINLAIRDSVLTSEDIQQLKAVLHQNTTIQHLILRGNHLRNTGLSEIASGLYRNTSIKSLDLSYNGLDDVESANVLRELIRRNKTITSLCIADNAFGRSDAAARSIVEGVSSNTVLQQLDLGRCGLVDQDISVLANALGTRNASILEVDLRCNGITSVGVRALVDDNMEALKTLTKLCLTFNPVKNEGATILADALGRNALPSLKRLHLDNCSIEDDGFVALVSALEQNTSLQILDLQGNHFGERGYTAFAESLPNITGLHQINLRANISASFESNLPLLLGGFRKNTSLVEVKSGAGANREWSQEMKFLGQRNRFTPLLKTSDRLGACPRLGIWSRALATVAAEPDVLFYVLRNKPKLVGGSKKRKRGD